MEPLDRETQFYSLAKERGLKPFSRSTLDQATTRMARILFNLAATEKATTRAHSWVVACSFFILSVAFAQSIKTLLIHFSLAILAILVLKFKLKRLISPGLWLAYGFSLAMALPALFNIFYDGQIIIPLGHVTPTTPFGITREGALTAATFFLRTTASITAIFALLSMVRWNQLLQTFRLLRFPAIFVQITGMTISFMSQFLRQTYENHLGKKSRTFCHSPLRREYQWIGSRLAHSWDRSLNVMIEVEQAMTARGFTGQKPEVSENSISWRHWLPQGFALSFYFLLLLGVHLV